MNILEHLYNQNPSSDNFVIRKVQLETKTKTNLYGSRGSGKSAIVFDFLNTYYEDEEEYLYIDFDDPLLFFESIDANELEEFMNENEIHTLVLDHFNSDKLAFIPDVETTIIVSRQKLELEGFENQELFALDYEEFIAFEKKAHQNSLNNFLKLGSLPQFAQKGIIGVDGIKRFLDHAFSSNEQQLLAILAMHNTKPVTINQIYLSAKEHFKISKDWLYRTLKEWEKEKIIIFLNNRYQKSSKKMIFFDFVLPKYLTTTQSFIMRFDNLVALAILKHYHEFESIGSSEYYINSTNEVIILSPFDSEENIWKKCYLKLATYEKYKIKKAIIVTIANQYSFKIKDIEFEGLSFGQWSIVST